MTYGELLLYGETKLSEERIADAKTDSWLLFSYCFNINRTQFILKQNELIKDFMKSAYEVLIECRLSGKPVQYILGTQEFFGIKFFVNSNVLIPRQDTEILVETVLEDIGSSDCVLDMCTGSGCIAISLKNNKKDLIITASDLSDEALGVARMNAWYNGTDINFIQGDLFENISDKFDVIVSNPPYICSDIIEGLDINVRKFEPMMALDGGNDGIMFYSRIISDARQYLKNRGHIYFEIGFDQGESVTRLLGDAGFKNVSIIKDLAGLDRVVKAES